MSVGLTISVGFLNTLSFSAGVPLSWCAFFSCCFDDSNVAEVMLRLEESHKTWKLVDKKLPVR